MKITFCDNRLKRKRTERSCHDHPTSTPNQVRKTFLQGQKGIPLLAQFDAGPDVEVLLCTTLLTASSVKLFYFASQPLSHHTSKRNHADLWHKPGKKTFPLASYPFLQLSQGMTLFLSPNPTELANIPSVPRGLMRTKLAFHRHCEHSWGSLFQGRHEISKLFTSNQGKT